MPINGITIEPGGARVWQGLYRGRFLCSSVSLLAMRRWSFQLYVALTEENNESQGFQLPVLPFYKQELLACRLLKKTQKTRQECLAPSSGSGGPRSKLHRRDLNSALQAQLPDQDLMDRVSKLSSQPVVRGGRRLELIRGPNVCIDLGSLYVASPESCSDPGEFPVYFL